MSAIEQRRPALVWQALLFIAIWTLLGVFFGARLMLTFAYSGRLADWRTPFLLSLCEWYGWAVVTPFLFFINRRLPLNSKRWYMALALHLPLSLVVSIFKMIGDRQLFVRVLGFSSLPPDTAEKVHANIVTYWAILGISVGIDYYRRYKDREASLAQARLSALNMQLHPHFLFNTLNAVTALMHRDVDGAERMLARLSELLRLSLDSGDLNETVLRQELDYLDRYLAIESIRFADRLRIERDISSEALDALVPTLILLPIVENAVRHGIAPRSDPGWIRISAAKRGSRLLLEVRNTGLVLNIQSLEMVRKGIGLTNTNARLEQLYGRDYRFEVRSEHEIFVASIGIPFHA